MVNNGGEWEVGSDVGTGVLNYTTMMIDCPTAVIWIW